MDVMKPNAMTKNKDKIETDLELFRDLINKTNDAIFITDPQTDRFIFVNDKACTSLGYDRQELLKMNVMDIETNFPDNFSWQAHLDELRQKGSHMSEGIHKRKDGATFPVEVNVSVVVLNAREYMLAVVRDMTERKQAEEALRTHEKRLAESQRIAHIGSWERNLTTGHLFWSAEMFRILGLNPKTDPVNFEMFFDMVHPDDKPVLKKAIDETVRLHRPFNIEYRLIPGNGSTRNLHAQAELINDYTGTQIILSGTCQDITERKQVIERYSRELEQSNRELDNFASIAAHDLGAPLRAVSGFAGLLQKRYKEKLDADADKYISYIVEGAGRMQNLIKDLLQYARVGTLGKLPVPVDVNDIIDKTLTNLTFEIQESRAVITVDSLPTVSADSTQLIQLFQNLVGNAIRYCSNTPRIHISAARKNGEWLFRVSDNGIGIDPRQFDRIFQIFQRLHARDEYSGTGIGLATCKKIVDRFGGRIWVDSKPGEGSTFFFTLPAAES